MDIVPYFQSVRAAVAASWGFLSDNSNVIQALATSLAVGSVLFAAVQIRRQARDADYGKYIEIRTIMETSHKQLKQQLKSITTPDCSNERYFAIYEYTDKLNMYAELYYKRMIGCWTRKMVKSYLKNIIKDLEKDEHFHRSLYEGVGMRYLKRFYKRYHVWQRLKRAFRRQFGDVRLEAMAGLARAGEGQGGADRGRNLRRGLHSREN